MELQKCAFCNNVTLMCRAGVLRGIMLSLVLCGLLGNSSCANKTIAANPPAADGANVEAVNPELTARQETTAERDARMRWWREAKFGLFIHWGVYAVPAGVHGEWIMRSAEIPVAEYRSYAKQFNPVEYDPQAWVQVAKEAGMKYIVITSKHHDGFALYPTKASDWNVVDATPYGKDLLGPLVQSAHDAGLKIGFYYSQAQDWNNPGGAKARLKEGQGWDELHKGDFDEYLKKVALPQSREILTQYPIDILWWDTPTWMNEQRSRPFADLLQLRPDIITNNRLGGGFGGDTQTPEQFVPVTGHKGDWETCMTLNDHWGYCAADDNWKSSTELIRKLIDICSKGGNFLLNVGPTAEGEFPQPCIDRLAAIGKWLDVNGDAIYGTTAGPFMRLPWGAATRKGNRLYLHVFEWPQDGKLRVPLRNTVKYASLLADPKTPLKVDTEVDRLIINLPKKAPDAVASVVVLDVTEEPAAVPLLAKVKTVTASASNAENPASLTVDGQPDTFWRTDKDGREAMLEFTLVEPTVIEAYALAEPDRWPRYRQEIRMEVETPDGWQKVLKLSTRGHGGKGRFEPVKTQRVRLYVERKGDAPGLAELFLFSPV